MNRAPVSTIADAGPSRKRIAITIPAEIVAEQLREALAGLARDARIPGFRRGRAPLALVERRFAPAVRSSARDRLVRAAYASAVAEHGLSVVGEPTREEIDAIQIRPGEALSFELDVDVLPEFAVPDPAGAEIQRPAVVVTGEMVEAALRGLELNEARLERRNAAEPGDYLRGHGIVAAATGGTVFHDIPAAVVQVPSGESGRGMILGILVEDLARQLGRPQTGETITIRAVGPEHHELEALRATPIVITFTVARIDRIIPATREHLASVFGMRDEAALRAAVRVRLERRERIGQESAMRQQLARHLVERAEIPLPERLTARHTARILERRRLELMYRGVEVTALEEQIGALRAASAAAARRELKLFFVLERAARELGIEVTDAEVDARIAELADDRRVSAEALGEELGQRNELGGVRRQIREHKALDALLRRATVVDVQPGSHREE